ncbi:short-chain dehydrogenase, putative [Ixodes scapularis]|uniref:Short-chain dehydrogenase, putative n=1 Tax=Ixodes scapularis TaxID=6945 RepID=B7Q3A4_IXOSC|nr:short-chain dehydrogenase, putative [Ixodes scapularis]|eukprot:XP_002411202.1 short-chain dehydrogenase, putative [Ixodes scapularis]
MEVLPTVMFICELLCLVGRCVVSVLVYVARLAFPGPKKSIRDNIVLVTGAGHGLGREIALKCASLGATLVLLDINKLWDAMLRTSWNL